MSIQTVGILSPGDMGHAIGAVLHQHQMRVITNLRGRSSRTVALAKTTGFSEVSDDETLVREADVLLSILPPGRAYALAERIAAVLRTTSATLLFVDCNAIAPHTTQAIEQLLTEAGASTIFVLYRAISYTSFPARHVMEGFLTSRSTPLLHNATQPSNNWQIPRVLFTVTSFLFCYTIEIQYEEERASRGLSSDRDTFCSLDLPGAHRKGVRDNDVQSL